MTAVCANEDRAPPPFPAAYASASS